MDGYKATITEASFELSKKERVAFKDLDDAISLDTATEAGEVEIPVKGYVVIDVHNEKSDNQDYKKYVIVDEAGRRYVTGSDSFYSAFLEIWDEMKAGEDPEDFSIRAYKRPSKNYSGKSFLTCSLVMD